MSSNWAKTPSTCSIHIPRLDPGLLSCHFIHFPSNLLEAEKITLRRLRPNCEKCCQIGPIPLPHAPYTSPDLILASCHAISFIRSHFQPNPLRRRKKARRHGMRPKREKCHQIGPNPLLHAPYISLDLTLTSCDAISSIFSDF